MGYREVVSIDLLVTTSIIQTSIITSTVTYVNLRNNQSTRVVIN